MLIQLNVFSSFQNFDTVALFTLHNGLDLDRELVWQVRKHPEKWLNLDNIHKYQKF
jgi:hypothetical protein